MLELFEPAVPFLLLTVTVRFLPLSTCRSRSGRDLTYLLSDQFFIDYWITRQISDTKEETTSSIIFCCLADIKNSIACNF